MVPGSGLVTDAKEARRVAAELEYPVMVKSTAGGGGIGLQKVDSEEDIERVFQTVQHQGKSYFGDSGVFLERFVENARHVEIQMVGDGYGKALAIGERDCSLQRRNQKIIEETPAPNLPEATRQRMRRAAESLGSLLHYKCAGTVEYIYDEKRDEFYFWRSMPACRWSTPSRKWSPGSIWSSGCCLSLLTLHPIFRSQSS